VADGRFGNHAPMMQGDRIAARLWVCGVAAVLSACGGEDPAATATPGNHPAVHAPKANAKKGPTVAEQTVGMVSAVSLGKSDVGVSLRFELQERPRVGQPLAINLAVIPHIAADSGKVSVTSADGFEPLGDAASADLDSMTAEEVYRCSIHVTPAKLGVLLVTVTVSLKHDEIAETRDFSIPVLVEAQIRK